MVVMAVGVVVPRTGAATARRPRALLADLRAARASLNRAVAALETANGVNTEDRE